MSKANPDRDPWDRYFTAGVLAARIAEWACIDKGTTVLEPSAGEGALVAAALVYRARVTAVELLEEQANHLRRLVGGAEAAGGSLLVHQADFLNWRTAPNALFDLALMNPPFSDGADGRHVAHATRQAKRTVALVRTNFEHTAGRWLSCLQYVRITRKVVLVRRPPPFGGPGNRDQTPMSDYVVLELQRRQLPREPGEADLVAVEYWE